MKLTSAKTLFPIDDQRQRILRLEKLEGRWMLSANPMFFASDDTSVSDRHHADHRSGQVSSSGSANLQSTPHQGSPQDHRQSHRRDSKARQAQDTGSASPTFAIAAAQIQTQAVSAISTPEPSTPSSPALNNATRPNDESVTLFEVSGGSADQGIRVSTNTPSFADILATIDSLSASDTLAIAGDSAESTDDVSSPELLDTIARSRHTGDAAVFVSIASRSDRADALHRVLEFDLARAIDADVFSNGLDDGFSGVMDWLDEIQQLQSSYRELDQTILQLSEQRGNEHRDRDSQDASYWQPTQPNDWLSETHHLLLPTTTEIEQGTIARENAETILQSISSAGWSIGIGIARTFQTTNEGSIAPVHSTATSSIDIASWRVEPSEDAEHRAPSGVIRSSTALFAGAALTAMGLWHIREHNRDAATMQSVPPGR